MFSSGLRGWRRRRALGQAHVRKEGLQPGLDMDTLGCSHHATGESSVPPQRSKVYTHDPAAAHHSAAWPASVPTPGLEAVGVTPPEPGTLFNDMSGQNVAALHEEARGWEGFKPGARLGCVLAFI